MRSAILSLALILCFAAHAGIPKKFRGTYLGFEMRAVAGGRGPKNASAQMQITAAGLDFQTAPDEKGRVWSFTFPDAAFSESRPIFDLRTFRARASSVELPDVRLFVKAFPARFNQGLPKISLTFGDDTDDPFYSQFYPDDRRLDENLSWFYARSRPLDERPRPLDGESVERILASGDLNERRRLVLTAGTGLAQREGMDARAANGVLHSAIFGANGSSELQLLALQTIARSRRASAGMRLLTEVFENLGYFPTSVMGAAIQAAEALAGTARAVGLAQVALREHYATDDLEELFTRTNGVIDPGCQDFVLTLLRARGQSWSITERLQFLRAIRNSSQAASVPAGIAARARALYTHDLEASHPLLRTMCERDLARVEASPN